MGIVQVLLASGLMTVLCLMLGSFLNVMHLGQNNAKYRMDADTLAEETRALLSSPEACANSFLGLQASAGAAHSVAVLRDGSASPGQVTYQSGVVYGDNSAKLEAMLLKNFVAGATPAKAQMTLILAISTAKAATGTQRVARGINLHLDLDATGKIVNCIAMSKMSDGIWQRSFDGALTHIHYTPPPAGGNVGIGTANPQRALHVVGTQLLESKDASAWSSALKFQKSRAGGPVAANDELGWIDFMGLSAGAAHTTGARIMSHVEAAAGADMPSTLEFWTRPLGSGITEQMRITSAGHIGIGTTNPVQKLQVGKSGDGTVAVANAWNTFSDARLKIVVGRIGSASEILGRLNGYYYFWKEGEDKTRQVGVIAQEVEQVLPELVRTGPDGIKTVDYPKLSAVLIESNKELRAEMHELRGEVESMKRALCAGNPSADFCRR